MWCGGPRQCPTAAPSSPGSSGPPTTTWPEGLPGFDWGLDSTTSIISENVPQTHAKSLDKLSLPLYCRSECNSWNYHGERQKVYFNAICLELFNPFPRHTLKNLFHTLTLFYRRSPGELFSLGKEISCLVPPHSVWRETGNWLECYRALRFWEFACNGALYD